MKIEEAITQLKMDRDLCNFNPMTGEEEPMNEDCRKTAEALDMAIKSIEEIDILARALIGIAEYECCDYGYTKAFDIAERITMERSSTNG